MDFIYIKSVKLTWKYKTKQKTFQALLIPSGNEHQFGTSDFSCTIWKYLNVMYKIYVVILKKCVTLNTLNSSGLNPIRGGKHILGGSSEKTCSMWWGRPSHEAQGEQLRARSFAQRLFSRDPRPVLQPAGHGCPNDIQLNICPSFKIVWRLMKKECLTLKLNIDGASAGIFTDC